MSTVNKALRNATGLVQDSNRKFEVRAPPEDTVFARISLLAGWHSIRPESPRGFAF
ncbi:hypothetical protein [Desulfosporosinus sp. OT]|uniref:hypothetical protein n=1 Tax=Desulfosporosinus sp. OT TaxID=913865 RepID=UPI001A98ED31|nr:hypothetical protein [Desulfosporosinus sp. OT]